MAWPLGERLVASHFLGLMEQDSGGNPNQTGRQMSNRHLIPDGFQGIVGRLFGLPITESRKVLFDGLPVFEGVLEFVRISGDTGAGIVGHIDVLGTAVAFSGMIGRMICRTDRVVFGGGLFACF